MQWILVTSNSETGLPEPGEQVLGLWLGGFWKKIIYSPDDGWYTSRDGVEQVAPTWWARVDSRPPKVSEVGEVGPVGEEGPLGPDASVMERVRKFLERLIEVRDQFTENFETPVEGVGDYMCYDDWAAGKAAELLKMISLLPVPPSPIQVAAGPPLALDISLEQARALHRVWRALNDGDCPKCHKFHAATEIIRNWAAITCPSCWFHVKRAEIAAIEEMFAPAMDAAVAIFNQWRIDTRCDNCGGMRITKKTMEAHWPADFKPEGPDHVPDGFCNGLCGALGAVGPPGLPAAS